jgi:hypothetical protein
MGSAWEEAAQMAQPRFFHQLLPAPDGAALFAIAGASQQTHLADIEQIRVVNNLKGRADSRRD